MALPLPWVLASYSPSLALGQDSQAATGLVFHLLCPGPISPRPLLGSGVAPRPWGPPLPSGGEQPARMPPTGPCHLPLDQVLARWVGAGGRVGASVCTQGPLFQLVSPEQ